MIKNNINKNDDDIKRRTDIINHVDPNNENKKKKKPVRIL
jgi:hypothetical protein